MHELKRAVRERLSGQHASFQAKDVTSWANHIGYKVPQGRVEHVIGAKFHNEGLAKDSGDSACRLRAYEGVGNELETLAYTCKQTNCLAASQCYCAKKNHFNPDLRRIRLPHDVLNLGLCTARQDKMSLRLRMLGCQVQTHNTQTEA